MESMPSKPRPISQFMAQEMLHDYVGGHLDKARQEAVEQALKDYPALQKELELFKAANEYCDLLAQTKVSPDLTEELSHVQSLSSKLFGRLSWSQWPDAIKWTTEALVLSSMVIVFTVVTPWEDLKKWAQWEAPPPATIIEPEVKPVEVKPVEKEPKPEEKKVVVVAAKPEVKPTSVPTPTPVVKPQGVLHRMMMKVPNIEGRADEVAKKIIALGGKKAGQVRLGWRKPNGNYYHFSIPKNNQKQLANTLGEYGPVRMYHHPHERVMPKGVIRIILFIEDGPEPKMLPNDEPVQEEAPIDEQAVETEQEEA